MHVLVCLSTMKSESVKHTLSLEVYLLILSGRAICACLIGTRFFMLHLN